MISCFIEKDRVVSGMQDYLRDWKLTRDWDSCQIRKKALVLSEIAQVAELVDAEDLKSFAP